MHKFIFMASILITILYTFMLGELVSLSESFLLEGHGLHPGLCLIIAVIATTALVITHIMTYDTLTRLK